MTEINFVDWSTFTEEDFNRLKEYFGGNGPFRSFHAGGVQFKIYKAIRDHSVFIDCNIPYKENIATSYGSPGNISQDELDKLSYADFKKSINTFLCYELAGKHGDEYAMAIDDNSLVKKAKDYMNWRRNHTQQIESTGNSYKGIEDELKYSQLYMREVNEKQASNWYGSDDIKSYWNNNSRWLQFSDNGRMISAPEDYVVENLYRDFCDENKGHSNLEMDSRFQNEYIPAHIEDAMGYIRLMDEQDRRIAMQKAAEEEIFMSNEVTTKYQVSEEEKALREELANNMAAKAAEGKAVWQVSKDERPIMHMPVNPRTGNYFQNGTALMLMQAQFEKNTADNRWISAKALNTLQGKENLDIMPKKGETAFTIVSGGKPVKYFNYSQLIGKDVPNGIEIVDKSKDSLGESMLNYMQFKATQAKETASVTKENFWELAKKAQYSATCFVQKMQTELEKSMSVYKDAMPEFEKRLAAIKNYDKEATPKSNKEIFMNSMAWSITRNPDKHDYVMKAAASALIKQVPEKTVIKLIDTYAPEAAKDTIKQENGKGRYSKFVIDTLRKDKMLQAKIEAGKTKSAAR